ncbi:MAG: glycosyltransferase [Spirochaetales bacterium]|nr:glycosyltransferase [Spirochaetales bacterium]
MLVQDKKSDDPTVLGPRSAGEKAVIRLRTFLDQLPLAAYPHRGSAMFSPAWVPFSPVLGRLRKLAPDIIHLHWVQKGMLSINDWKKLPGPIVWTLHDMWAFTGGDHYDCDQQCFTRQCGHCTALGSKRNHDLSQRIWRQKQAAWRQVPLTLVTPSRWLGEQAKRSSLLGDRPLHVIPNGIDTELYRPVPKDQARSLLKLSAERKWLLLSGLDLNEDPRKGFDLLTETLNLLASRRSDLGLLIAGASWSPHQFLQGLECRFLGKLEDDLSLVLAYNAADLVLLPSRQENFSNAMVEAMACGVPVAGFHIGGNPDMIIPGETGVLAPPFDTKALASGIEKLLSHPEALRQIAHQARNRAVEVCSLPQVAQRYYELFASLEDFHASGHTQKVSYLPHAPSYAEPGLCAAAPPACAGSSSTMGSGESPNGSRVQLDQGSTLHAD